MTSVDSFLAKLKATRASNAGPEARLKAIHSTLPPLLQEIEFNEGKTSEAYQACANGLAWLYRDITVEFSQSESAQDVMPGLEAAQESLSFATDPALKKILETDISRLTLRLDQLLAANPQLPIQGIAVSDSNNPPPSPGSSLPSPNPWPVAVVGMLLAGALVWIVAGGEIQIRKLKHVHGAKIHQVEEARKKQIEKQIEQEQEEQRHKLGNTALISGDLAKEAHRQEWSRRLDYDPAFAVSLREKTILQMRSLSKDKSLAPADLMREVAKLAAPKNSTVVVQPETNGFRVAVTFDMSAMTSGESGSETKHTSIDALKKEVVQVMSNVFKDLYNHCGHRDIESISVACTHGIKRGDELGLGLGTTVTGTIYKCMIARESAARVSSWRQVPLHQVTELMQVEQDEFPHLVITQRKRF